VPGIAPPGWDRQAVVEAINTGPPPSLQLTLGGTSVGPVRYLASYVPTVGDAVWCRQNGTDLLVLGALAGGGAIAGSPTVRVATTIVTSDSGNVTTTETAVISVTGPVVQGRTYRITFIGEISTSQTGVFTLTRIRADSATGDNLMFRREYSVDLARPLPYQLEAEYEHVDPDEDKTFVFTLLRETGTGNHWLNAAAAAPAYMYLDYIRG
jgi:hypothetical protein